MAGFIYCIQMGTDGPVKIGFTSGDPEQRLRSLQTGNPAPLRLVAAFPGNRDGEKLFHEAFAELRLHGEWFQYSEDLLRSFDAVGQHAPGLATKPPKTEAGIAHLALIGGYPGCQPRYGGTPHCDVDWDEVAEYVAGAIEQYEAAQ